MQLRFRPAGLAWLGAACVAVGILASCLQQYVFSSATQLVAWSGSVGATVLGVVAFVPQLVGGVLIALAVAFRWTVAPGQPLRAGGNSNSVSSSLDN